MHKPRKRFGQHFLRDIHVLNQIVSAIEPNVKDHVLEVGPGEGVLTKHLIDKVAHYDAVELDRDLIPLLNNQFTQSHFHLHQQDILKFDLTQLNHPTRVVGNIPYQITTPLIFHLLEARNILIDIHFLIQLEVALRICAQPNSKSYGRLSVMSQFYCEAYNLFEVDKSAFYPPPKVQSAVIRLTPKKNLPHVSILAFDTIVRAAFAQRRKTLQNTLKGLLSPEDIQSICDPKARAQALDVATFVALAQAYEAKNQNL